MGPRRAGWGCFDLSPWIGSRSTQSCEPSSLIVRVRTTFLHLAGESRRTTNGGDDRVNACAPKPGPASFGYRACRSRRCRPISPRDRPISRRVPTISRRVRAISRRDRTISRCVRTISQRVRVISRCVTTISRRVLAISRCDRVPPARCRVISCGDQAIFMTPPEIPARRVRLWKRLYAPTRSVPGR